MRLSRERHAERPRLAEADAVPPAAPEERVDGRSRLVLPRDEREERLGDAEGEPHLEAREVERLAVGRDRDLRGATRGPSREDVEPPHDAPLPRGVALEELSHQLGAREAPHPVDPRRLPLVEPLRGRDDGRDDEDRPVPHDEPHAVARRGLERVALRPRLAAAAEEERVGRKRLLLAPLRRLHDELSVGRGDEPPFDLLEPAGSQEEGGPETRGLLGREGARRRERRRAAHLEADERRVDTARLVAPRRRSGRALGLLGQERLVSEKPGEVRVDRLGRERPRRGARREARDAPSGERGRPSGRPTTRRGVPPRGAAPGP